MKCSCRVNKAVNKLIDVVAALTLSTLIKNYQKQVYVNQLKSAYSTLGQGFKKMLADEGVDRL